MRTLDGVPYYYNSVSEELSWEKPDSLKTAQERETESGDFCWVRDPLEAWAPARIVKKHADGSYDLQTLAVRDGPLARRVACTRVTVEALCRASARRCRPARPRPGRSSAASSLASRTTL